MGASLRGAGVGAFSRRVGSSIRLSADPASEIGRYVNMGHPTQTISGSGTLGFATGGVERINENPLACP
jgi:hypothetical protein